MPQNDRPCSISGCGNRAKARGWCGRHYMRWWMHGDPNAVIRHVAPAGEPIAFLTAAIAYAGDECLLWPYAKNNEGYGQINLGSGRKKLAHRAVCEETHGAPPNPSAESAHGCGNGHKGCVTPRHLRWATRAENAADMVAHGRSTRGTKSPANKLTEAQAIEVFRRAQTGEPQQAIASSFGISQTAVGKIARRETWGWLTASLIGTTADELHRGASAANNSARVPA